MPDNIVVICNRIRSETPQEPGERAEAYFKRTWKMAIAELEAKKPPLPLVEARRARSEAKLKHIFTEWGTTPRCRERRRRMTSYGGLSPEVERRLQAGPHVMQEHDRELLLDEVRRDEIAREAGARQRHKEQQAQDRADAIMTPEQMERFREAYQSTFERVTREGWARQSASQARPLKKACPVPLHVCRDLSVSEEERLRKAFQDLIPRGFSPEEAGEILDSVKRLLTPAEIEAIMAAH